MMLTRRLKKAILVQDLDICRCVEGLKVFFERACKRIAMIAIFLFFSISATAVGQEKPDADAAPKDEEVIAVLDILELMEMMDDIAMFKDMEYLNEGDPNEPQD